MAERIARGKVHGIDPRARAKLLEGTQGTGDVVLNLRGSKYLPPKERAIVQSRPKATAALPVERPREDPDVLPPWFWNPGNPMATHLPASVSLSRYREVLAAIKKIDRNIGLTWHPDRHIWQIWYYKPGFTPTMPWTNGWVMMKELEPFRDTAYILAVVKYMDMAARGISLKKLHDQRRQDRIDQRRRAREQRMARDEQIAGEVYDHTNIKNIGKGSKFATYHS